MAEMAWKVVDANRPNRTELTTTKKVLKSGETIDITRDEDFDHLVNDLKQSIAEMRESAEIQKATRYYYMSSGEDGLTRPHGRDVMGHDDDDYSW